MCLDVDPRRFTSSPNVFSSVGFKRPILPWVSHEDDVFSSAGADSALYDYSDVSTALVWDAPLPAKRKFPLRFRSSTALNSDSPFTSTNYLSQQCGQQQNDENLGWYLGVCELLCIFHSSSKQLHELPFRPRLSQLARTNPNCALN